MQDAKAFWLAAAECYIRECRIRRRAVCAAEFAASMGRTPVQLVREFRVAVGAGVKDYLSARQIAHAKELLRTTRRSTAEIAVESGFGTARSFYRAFKRAAGSSPTAFRKEMSLAGMEVGN